MKNFSVAVDLTELYSSGMLGKFILLSRVLYLKHFPDFFYFILKTLERTKKLVLSIKLTKVSFGLLHGILLGTFSVQGPMTIRQSSGREIDLVIR